VLTAINLFLCESPHTIKSEGEVKSSRDCFLKQQVDYVTSGHTVVGLNKPARPVNWVGSAATRRVLGSL